MFQRWSVVPFEVAFGALSVFAGTVKAAGLAPTAIEFTPFFPHPLIVALNIGLAAAGLAILGGLSTARRDVEGAGIVLLITTIVTRAAGIVLFVGLVPLAVSTIVFYAVLVATFLSRLRALFAGSLTVKIDNHQAQGTTHTDIAGEDLQMRRHEQEEADDGSNATD